MSLFIPCAPVRWITTQKRNVGFGAVNLKCLIFQSFNLDSGGAKGVEPLTS